MRYKALLAVEPAFPPDNGRFEKRTWRRTSSRCSFGLFRPSFSNASNANREKRLDKSIVLLYYVISTIREEVKSQLEDYNPNIPIYLQIMEQIKFLILSEQWRAGGKIPSVRDLAIQFRVNPNTMQRALSELERDKLIYSERTSGRFVTDDLGAIDTVRQQMADEYIQVFVRRMKEINFSMEDVVNRLEEAYRQ